MAKTIPRRLVALSSSAIAASRIASLPAQVLQAQSANVNGATASSQAFKQAVQQALVQATTVSVSA